MMTHATLLNPSQPNHCFIASTVRARERQIRAPQKCILGVLTRGPYPEHVTVYPYNGYIGGTNPIVRHVMSLTWTLKRMRANQRTPKHAKSQQGSFRAFVSSSSQPKSQVFAEQLFPHRHEEAQLAHLVVAFVCCNVDQRLAASAVDHDAQWYGLWHCRAQKSLRWRPDSGTD